MKKFIPYCLILLICSFSGKEKYSSKPNSLTLQMLLDSLRHKENLVVDSSNFKDYKKIKPNEALPFGYYYCKKNDFKIDFVVDTLKRISKYLKIGGSIFDLERLYFWRAGRKNDLVYRHIYSTSCEDIEKIRFAGMEYIFFSASYYMCNGSGCGVQIYFLCNLTDNKLFAFENFRGYIEVGDVDGDEKLDILQVLPKDAWERMDVAYITPFSLSQTGTYKPMLDSLGKPYQIWFKIGNRQEWYGLDKKITILKSYWLK